MLLCQKAILACGAMFALSTASFADNRPINGEWDIGNNAGSIVIRGTSWFHPKYGSAVIKRTDDAGDFAVLYTDHQGVRCSYRAALAADGDILVLTSASSAQSPDFCPSGRFLRLKK